MESKGDALLDGDPEMLRVSVTSPDAGRWRGWCRCRRNAATQAKQVREELRRMLAGSTSSTSARCGWRSWPSSSGSSCGGRVAERHHDEGLAAVVRITMEKKPRHILMLSGGKDSTALAIYMRDRVPDMEYVFCDTDKELPETYEYLTKIEYFLGKQDHAAQGRPRLRPLARGLRRLPARPRRCGGARAC